MLRLLATYGNEISTFHLPEGDACLSPSNGGGGGGAAPFSGETVKL